MTNVLQFKQSVEEPSCNKTGVVKKPGSNKLYIDLRYNGKRIQKSSGLDDTPENAKQLQEWVDRQKDKIERGVFKFAEAFPNSSDDEKAYHASHEGWDFKSESRNVLFREYAERWMKKNFKDFPPGMERDYTDIIEYRILPFFGDKIFSQINGVVLKDFVKTLTWKEGKKKGQKLSASRVRNILIPLRAIWNDAIEEHQWEVPDPFSFIKRYLARDLKDRPKKDFPIVFRFCEWIKVIGIIDPFYRLIAEVMMLTGMIGSEIAGLRKDDIKEDRIVITNSIVRNHEKSKLKTEYRKRDVPLTKAIRERLDVAIERSQSDYVFSMKSGRIFDVDSFRKNAWTTALKKAGLEYRVPYTTRHTFAAWALTLGMDPNKLVKLMGHGSKKMVYEVYGQYVENLETDAGKILEYFGKDFIGL